MNEPNPYVVGLVIFPGILRYEVKRAAIKGSKFGTIPCQQGTNGEVKAECSFFYVNKRLRNFALETVSNTLADKFHMPRLT
jgi:hypothetical protein